MYCSKYVIELSKLYSMIKFFWVFKKGKKWVVAESGNILRFQPCQNPQRNIVRPATGAIVFILKYYFNFFSKKSK